MMQRFSSLGSALRVWEWAALAAICAVGLLLPVLVGDNGFILGLMGYTMAFAIFALSLGVMLGWAGEIALGQAMFFGMGAYVSAILMKTYGLGFVSATAVAILVTAASAMLIGAITLRLAGAYFSIVFWGVSGIAVVVANNWNSVTGGALGLYGVPSGTLGFFDLSQNDDYLRASTAMLVLVVTGLAVLRRSSLGVGVNATRMNMPLARSLGINAYLKRVQIFVVSASMAALSGALIVPHNRIVTPEIMSVFVTVDGLVMALIGGVGYLLGPVLGATFFSFIPEVVDIEPATRAVTISVLIIVVMLATPKGLIDLVARSSGAVVTSLRGRRDRREDLAIGQARATERSGDAAVRADQKGSIS